MDTLTSAHLLAAATAVEMRIALLEAHNLAGLPGAQDWTAREIARLRDCKDAFETEAHARHTWNDPSINDCPVCERTFEFWLGYPA